MKELRPWFEPFLAAFFLASLVTAGLAVLAAPGWAATTSNLTGTITDNSNQEPLPGVTVTAESPQLIGSRSAVTDEKGQYRFVALPPGAYTVTATISGFDAASDEIRLLLGKDAVLNLSMGLRGVTAEAVVTAESPVVEVTNTEVKTSIDDELVRNIPIFNRNFLALATLAPGVNSDPVGCCGLNVNGGRVTDQSFRLDGLNITDTMFGWYGVADASVNLDAIQELEVITNGFSAEHGKAQGGIINVITKSGGNELHGTASYYYRGSRFDGLSNDDDFNRGAAEEQGRCNAPGKPDCGELVPEQEFDRHEVYLTAEGPLVKDKLWFFGTAQILQDEQVVSGLRPEWDAGRTLGNEGVSLFFKGTAQLSEKNTISLSYDRDPRDLVNRRMGRSGTSYWTHTVTADSEARGWIGSVRDTHVFSESLYLEALIGYQKGQTARKPQDESGFFGAALYPVDGVYVFRGGLYPFTISTAANRVEGKVDLTYFADWAGSHTFRTGFDLENQVGKLGTSYAPQLFGWDEATYDQALDLTGFGGSQRYPGDVSEHVDLDGDGIIDMDPATLELLGYAYVFDSSAANFDLQGPSVSGYVQDEWQLTETLTLNLGVRVDREVEILGIGGNLNVAPRFGVSFDPTGGGKLQLYGNTGIAYDKLFLITMTFPFKVGVSQLLVYPGPHTGSDPEDYFRFEDFDPDHPERGAIGSFGLDLPDGWLVDPDLKNPYTWYSSVGARYELIQDLALGATLIYREGHDLLQDVETNKQIDENNQLVSIDPDYDNIRLLTNVNSSEYRAVQLEVSKRFSRGWQMLASYTLSRAEGDGRNYDSGEDNDPRLFDEEYGVLAYDRTHDFKVSGNVDLPLGFHLGVSGKVQTGTPYSKLFTINHASIADGLFRPEQLRDVTYVGGKNAERLPSQTILDLHLEKGFDLGPADIRLLADVFNVTDEDTAVGVNQAVSYGDFDKDGDNEFSPSFGTPTQRLFGRRFQLGAKIAF